ncbi:MAG: hypothetical protein OXE42_13090 [Gammaproteobacteria bacterium]|nr:hypothetical protein [Gammaproteobacteria bacterium]
MPRRFFIFSLFIISAVLSAARLSAPAAAQAIEAVIKNLLAES